MQIVILNSSDLVLVCETMNIESISFLLLIGIP